MDDYRQPRNKAQATAALSIRRGTRQHRHVDWHHFTSRDVFDRHDINVKPGNTLRITVWSGIPRFHVRSGHVEIEFHSTWGNSVTIHDGASAHIVVPDADTKVHIDTEGGAYTMDIPAGTNRVYWPGKYTDLTQPF